jgi:predicted Zn-dependent protease
MQALTTKKMRELYELDSLAWYETTLAQIKNNQLNELDLESLGEVLENLIRDTKRSGENYLRQIIIHLLLIEYWESERINYRHWAAEIVNFRSELETDMTKNLRKHLGLVKENIYQKALRYVLTKTGLNKAIFPTQCPYNLEQLLENDWFPDNINLQV